MTAQVKIMAVLAARPGKAEELRALLDRMLDLSRAEPGNLRYDLWQDHDDASRFVLDELYVDAAAVAAHRETAHFRDYLTRIADLAERSAMALDPVRVG